jgi:hypothetical protein
VAVPVVDLADSAAVSGAGADVAVGGRPVGRRGEYERHVSAQPGGQQAGKQPGVGAPDLARAGGPGVFGVADVVGGQVRPAGLVLDANAVTAQMHGFDEGGADAGLAGWAVEAGV